MELLMLGKSQNTHFASSLSGCPKTVSVYELYCCSSADRFTMTMIHLLRQQCCGVKGGVKDFPSDIWRIFINLIPLKMIRSFDN